MPRVVHFEIHATEPEQLVAFYAGLFGWTFTKAEGMDYWLDRDRPAGRARHRRRARQEAGPRPGGLAGAERVPVHRAGRVGGRDAGQG